MELVNNEKYKEEVKKKLRKAKEWGWVGLVMCLVSLFRMLKPVSSYSSWVDSWTGVLFLIGIILYERKITDIAFFKGYDEGYKDGTAKDFYQPIETDLTNWWREKI